jgi:hypothetical protein
MKKKLAGTWGKRKKKKGYWPVQINGNKFATNQILKKPIEVVKGRILVGWAQKSLEPWDMKHTISVRELAYWNCAYNRHYWPHNLYSSSLYLFHYQSEDFSAHEASHIGPLIMFTIESRVVNIFKHCQFLDPHPTTYHSNINVMTNVVLR